jgi:RNA polymerase sigma-70 factor (ECF subfamily)
VKPGLRRPAAPPSAASAVDAAYREHWSRLVALLATQSRRLDLAEDCVQEAFVTASDRWSRDGVPDNPPAWLLVAARRRLLDRLRTETSTERRLPRLIVEARVAATPFEEVEDRMLEPADGPMADERLRLLFMSCHPALATEARAALTLRFVGGLTVPEIARLLLVQETTMAARITRAKQKIATAGIPLRVPEPDQVEERLTAVLVVLYLMFTEGYSATGGELMIRTELAAEAIRLTSLVEDLLPGEPHVRALRALMLLQHARRDARFDGGGNIVLLPDQDRSRWHADEIAEAVAILEALGRPASPSADDQYLLQALIASEHAAASTAADTDWHTIERWYAELERVTGSPVVRLNRAVAAAEARGPLAGLALLDGLDAQLPRSHQLPAVRAELLLRLGERESAIAWFDRALGLVRTTPERRHLEARRVACVEVTEPGHA